jgi:hypothetical protein
MGRTVLARSAVLASLISLACTGRQISGEVGAHIRRDPSPQKCMNVRIDDGPIEIKKQGGKVKLGPGSFLSVPEDAVSQTRTYIVTKLAGDTAGFRIVALGDTTPFAFPITMLVKYQGCVEFEDKQDSLVIAKFVNGVPKSLPGIDDKNRKHVVAVVLSFSKFALAIN